LFCRNFTYYLYISQRKKISIQKAIYDKIIGQVKTITFKKIQIITLAIVLFALVSSLYVLVPNSNAASLEDKEAQLREELKRIEEEQAAVQKTLNVQKAQTATIQRDVNILTDQIYSAELNIKRKNIEISKLEDNIALKQNTVEELDEKMERSRKALTDLIKQTNEIDNTTLPEIILSNTSLNDFFIELDSYNTLQNQLEDLFDQVREIRAETEAEKEELANQQAKELDAKKEIEVQKQTINYKKAEKDNLLAFSKQSEATYESILEQKRAEASRIRTALFQLRDTDGIPFGEALEYAQKAERSTGVRAAFILAILTQESNLGKNVGTCNLPGQPESKKWTSIMPGPTDGSWRDDQTIFKQITKALGLDPDSVPLSCPWQGGWGGAMGPSQFIPYTWNAYSARIANAVGVKTADPWNPEHAIMATSLYVKDLGAAAGGYSAERTAALKYYAGSNWNLAQNAFYGNQVMVHVNDIQKQIDFLNDVD
jgi:membrane-bound lytic murein transglycosylase B